MSDSDSKPPAVWSSGPWVESHEFIKKLGDGGQGYTFQARRNSDQEEVAVKVLRSDRDTLKARRRMFREVNALRSLSKTEACVPAFIESNIDSAIEDSNVRPYVVMEFIDGPTLLKSQKKRGPLSMLEAISFSTSLTETVAIAHSGTLRIGKGSEKGTFWKRGSGKGDILLIGNCALIKPTFERHLTFA